MHPRSGNYREQAMRRVPRLPDFSVVVWLRETDRFETLKSELLTAAMTAPYESTKYQGMVDFHWRVTSASEAEDLVEALKRVAQRPELVLLQIMSRVEGIDSITIKDTRRTLTAK